MIREAIEKHDLVKFEKHVDTESLYNRAFDEVVQKNLTNSGYENNQLVMGLVGMLKKTAVDELINQTKKYVETGDFEIPGQKVAPAKTNQPDGKDVATNLNKNAGISYIQFKGIENTQKDGKIAVVTTKVYDKRVGKDFVIKHIKNFGSISKKELDELLMDKLPGHLNIEQKKRKIKYLVNENLAKKENQIENIGTNAKPIWVLKK